MLLSSKREAILLLLGDILCLVTALWLTLFLRFREAPDSALFQKVLLPFSILFIAWLGVFYVFGLYGKHTLLFKSRLPALLLRAQIANAFLAALFFYLAPFVTIAPKTILLIAVVLSFLFILFWRAILVPSLGFRKRQRAILIGEGDEKDELLNEVRGNTRYPFNFVSSLNLDKIDCADFEGEVLRNIHEGKVSVVVLDFASEKIDPVLPHFFDLLFSRVRFLDINTVYEDIFDRVPLSTLRHAWVLKNISGASQKTYDMLKRAMDLTISVVLGGLTLLLYPVVFMLIKFTDGGPVFVVQERVGRGNRIVSIYKFRTMKLQGAEQITRVGHFLRKSRIDELPQLFNVLRGDLSLIGPRPELAHLAKLYEEKIPYYNIRHLIKPGLSGWAQIHMDKPPKFEVCYNETKEKLSYDLYYIKHRSLLSDVKIGLFTIKTLLSRSGI
jgi:lipopolysaccharide/colanic/teichoic acid biosynthesis glycosyltransferase